MRRLGQRRAESLARRSYRIEWRWQGSLFCSLWLPISSNGFLFSLLLRPHAVPVWRFTLRVRANLWQLIWVSWIPLMLASHAPQFFWFEFMTTPRTYHTKHPSNLDAAGSLPQLSQDGRVRRKSFWMLQGCIRAGRTRAPRSRLSLQHGWLGSSGSHPPACEGAGIACRPRFGRPGLAGSTSRPQPSHDSSGHSRL